MVIKKTAYGYIWRYIDDNGNVKYKIQSNLLGN